MFGFGVEYLVPLSHPANVQEVVRYKNEKLSREIRARILVLFWLETV